MEETKMEVAVATSEYPVFAAKNEEMTIEDELFAEELEALGNIRLKFPKIKLGASGNGKLEIPDPNQPDESRSVKEFEGVIVMATTSRAKWNEENPTVPECASSNGKISFDGKACETCKFCKFKRDENGKLIRPDCKESRNVFLITKEHSMPLQFTIPPSGVKTYDDFARDLLSSRLTQLGTIVKITVDIAENSAKQKYNKAKFSVVGRVDIDTTKNLLELRNQIKNTLSTMTITDMTEEEDKLEPVNDDTMPF